MANIIISPSKYVQGKGELANIAQYATKLGKKPFILISEGGKKRVGGIIEDSFKDTGCELVFEAFHGECSKNEINRLVAIVKEKGCDSRTYDNRTLYIVSNSFGCIKNLSATDTDYQIASFFY